MSTSLIHHVLHVGQTIHVDSFKPSTLTAEATAVGGLPNASLAMTHLSIKRKYRNTLLSDRNPAVISTSGLQLATKRTHLACRCFSPTDCPMSCCNLFGLLVGNYKRITVATLTANQRKWLSDEHMNASSRSYLSKRSALWSSLIRTMAQKKFLPQTEYHNLVLTSVRHIVCRTTPPDRLTHAQHSFCLLDLTFVLLPHWSGTLLWSFCSVPVRNSLAESLSASLLWFHKHQFHLLITNVLFSGLSTLFRSACSESKNMFARL